MVRPIKSGIDYFPLDTDMEQDDKIALIEAKHGIIGFGVIIKIFKKIYGSNGYFYDWNEQTQLLFSKQIGIDFSKVIEIIEDAIRWELFDKKLWKTYGILTSRRIQKTYLEATGRRKEIDIIKEYVIDGISEYKNKDNVNIYSKNADNSTQKKRKEKKGKESKGIGDIITYLNLKAKKNFRPDSKIAVKNIQARLNENYTIEDFRKVIDIKFTHWFKVNEAGELEGVIIVNEKGVEQDMSQYFNPDTLFGNKFEKYLNQSANKKAIQEAVRREKENEERKKEDKELAERKPISEAIKKENYKILANVDPRFREKLEKLEGGNK